jgi:hypothetical protein
VLVFVLLALPGTAFGQGTIGGTVVLQGGLAAAGVEVQLLASGDTVPVRTTVTDPAGNFRFVGLAAGAYMIRSGPIGYARVERRVTVGPGAVERVDLELVPAAIELERVEVDATRQRQRFDTEAGATVRQLDRAEIKRVPGIAEADVLRAIAVLPGVVTTSDYSSAYNVRGGSSDQNLILLDGIPIYNPFHLGGIFSVFNADMVARTELYTGGFPAQFGGRVSSVLSVESDAGRDSRPFEGGVSLLAARAAVGGSLPGEAIGLERARGRLSVRRSYFDQLLRPAFDFPYHLTDVQAYGEAWTRGGDRLSVTGYTGRDVLDLSGLEDFPLKLRWAWGNDVIGGRWQRPLARGSLEARFGYSRFMTDIGFPDFNDTEFRSRIDHALVRLDWEALRDDGRWRAGAEANRLGYDNLAQTGGTVFRGSAQKGTLLGAYAQRDVRLGRWLLEAGLRGDGYSPDGGENVLVVAPRLAVKRFLGNGELAVKLAAGRYTQFVHSLRDEELPLGIDIWILAGPRAPHVVSDQLQGGIEGFLGGRWSYGAEVFYRTFDGVVTDNLADDPNDPSDDLVAGDGRSYGADFFISRDAGRLRPSVAVSWLRATRTFPDFRTGEEVAPRVTYPPIFDRRLDVDLMLLADLPRGLEASARIHVGTGLPYTRPLGSYSFYDYRIGDGLRAPQGGDDGSSAVVLGQRNSERYPAYQRVDMSLRRESGFRGGRLTWYLEVINVLNTRNVLFYFYEYDRDPPVRSGISMFPILPTIGVEFSF